MPMVDMSIIEEKVRKLEQILRNKVVVVSLSGGVDSTTMLLLAKRWAKKTYAVIFTAPIYREDIISRAKKLCEELGIEYFLIERNIFSDERITQHSNKRCYFCKQKAADILVDVCRRVSCDLIVDGTNASDIADDRPGLRALSEKGVRSPLAEVGLTKSEIRVLAKKLGVPWFDDPPESCYLMRVVVGNATPDRIRRIAIAEEFLRSRFSLRLVRVRDHGDLARIELSLSDIKKLSLRDFVCIVKKLRELGFRYVTLDMAGYHGEILDEFSGGESCEK